MKAVTQMMFCHFKNSHFFRMSAHFNTGFVFNLGLAQTVRK